MRKPDPIAAAPKDQLTADQFMDLPIDQRQEILTKILADDDNKKKSIGHRLDVYFTKN